MLAGLPRRDLIRRIHDLTAQLRSTVTRLDEAIALLDDESPTEPPCPAPADPTTDVVTCICPVAYGYRRSPIGRMRHPACPLHGASVTAERT